MSDSTPTQTQKRSQPCQRLCLVDNPETQALIIEHMHLSSRDLQQKLVDELQRHYKLHRIASFKRKWRELGLGEKQKVPEY